MPIVYISVVGLLVLRDEYRSRHLNRERFEARAHVKWPVTIETISGPMYGHTDNISATGALLVCLQPLYKALLTAQVIRHIICCCHGEGLKALRIT
jgi:hypothetical protein